MACRQVTRVCSQLNTSASPSAAQAFLLLAPRRYLHSTPPPTLDFLLPSLIRTTPLYQHNERIISSNSQVQLTRSFSSSYKRETTAIFNPRKDDDGNDMSVEITPRASNRLREIMSKDSNPNLALRIQVESGGCHGFQYLMSLTTLPPVDLLNQNSIQEEASPTEKTGRLDEDDTVFAANDDSGAKVVMDGPSLELLKGSKIDYTMELIGSQFKIIDNPLATSSCGCGTSFDIKS